MLMLSPSDSFVPFHLHHELAYQIKLSLNLSIRNDPDTRIELPFDRFLFGGGLQQAGKFMKKYRGNDIYTIKKFGDLDLILGKRWHVRVLNKQLDFCCVKLETVRYHLQRRRPVPNFQPDCEEDFIDGGYSLVFTFVRMDGVRRHWDDVIAIA